MRRSAAKKARRRDGSEGPVSLFPFLAVLICTMGSLILLLVVLARQARLQASVPDAPDFQEEREKIGRELEMARLLASQMDQSREVTNKDLDNVRFKLGQIEDHAGELRRQIDALETAWKQLDQLEEGKKSTRQAAESELADLEAKIRQQEREVELAKAEAAGRKPAYSIVPYEGPHGTKRRPIYIECRGDGLVLQPEGVVFRANDFQGSLDAGNPLDVALRAVREYLTAQQAIGSGEEEPYPLLLVRPSGIGYFYAGRAAMKSWGTDFGYELIGEDWELDFPPSDPMLQQTIVKAIEPARRRQQRLIAAAPSRFGGGDRPVYTVTPHRGGLQSRSGGGERSAASSFGLQPSGSHGGMGSQYGSNSGDEYGSGSGNQNGSASGSEKPGGRLGSNPAGTEIGGSRFRQPGTGSSASPGTATYGGQSRGSDASSQTSSSQVSFGSEGSSGGSSGSSNGDSTTGQAGATTGERGDSSPGLNFTATQSLAETRGRNWGLPDANQTAVAITRPIRLECHSDRLVIVPEAGLGSPKPIGLGQSTEGSIDSFVSTVWDYMEGWGRAGRGMYWRPVLNVYAAPDAASRVADLEALLQDSGLLVKRAGQLSVVR